MLLFSFQAVETMDYSNVLLELSAVDAMFNLFQFLPSIMQPLGKVSPILIYCPFFSGEIHITFQHKLSLSMFRCHEIRGHDVKFINVFHRSVVKYEALCNVTVFWGSALFNELL